MAQPSKLRCLHNYILTSHDCLAFVSNLELKWNTIKVNYKHTELTWLMQIRHLKVTHNHNNFRLGMRTTSQLIVAIVTTRCQKFTGSQCWCGNNPNSEFGPFAQLVPSHIQVSAVWLRAVWVESFRPHRPANLGWTSVWDCLHLLTAADRMRKLFSPDCLCFIEKLGRKLLLQ